MDNNKENEIPVIGFPDADAVVKPVSLQKTEEAPVSLQKPEEAPVNNEMPVNNMAPINEEVPVNNEIPVNNGMPFNSDIQMNDIQSAAPFGSDMQTSSPIYDSNRYGQQTYTGNVQAADVNQAPNKSTKAVISLILGILAIVICPLGLIFGAIALILGISSKKDTGNMSGMALGGIITGSVGLLFGLIAAVYILIIAAAMGTSISDYTGRANVSSDAQLCNEVFNALQYTMYDYDVMYERDYDVPTRGKHELAEFVESLGEAGQEMFLDEMGVKSVDEINKKLKAEGHKEKNSKSGIYVKIKNGQMSVYIPDSCPSGKGKKCNNKNTENEVGM